MKKYTIVMILVASSLLVPYTGHTESDTYWLRGGIIGGASGLALGLAIDGVAYGISRGSCESATCKYGSSAPYFYIPVLTTAVGFGTGALIGKAIKRKNNTVQVTPMIDPQTGMNGMMIQGSF